ncbi:MAG: hypothetical protein IT332_09055 [Ardenticatenales bacterium]|nr:hypothetical protein [Ardenticatenales bacterium]
MFVRSIHLSRRALSLALMFVLSACRGVSQPASTTTIAAASPPAIGSTTIDRAPTPTATGVPSHTVSVAGAHITVPDTLGSTIEAVEVPAMLDIPQPLASGVRFTLKDYPVRRGAPATIELRRGPVDREAGEHVMRRFRDMYNFISNANIKARYVPIFAQPSVREQFVALLRFQGMAGGTGTIARLVTQFGSAERPVNNQELVYVAEGLISGKAVWVSIVAPVTVADPAVAASADDVADPVAFAQDYHTYLSTTVERLNALPPEAFTPNLAHLDAIAKSIRLDWPEPSPEDIATVQSRKF